MLAPNPISLLCALLLCLPLAVIFTTTPATPPPPPPFSFQLPLSINKTHHIQKHSLNNTYTSHIYKNALKTTNNTTHVHKHSINKTNVYVQHHNNNITVWDEDDESVSRLASRVNPDPPLGRPKKIAFMFLTNAPLPLAPLWELYFNKVPNNLYNIYIHADPSSRYNSPFRGVFANRVIPSKPTRRFSPTLSAAARRLLSHALLNDTSNYMFALLSPSCIPLHSFNFTYKTIIKSRHSFIEILKNERGASGRWAARGNTTMLPEVPLSHFRIGSQFFILTRHHARIISNDTIIWSKFKLPCMMNYTYTCYPEEHYFPTLMSMVDPHGCVPSTLTHVDWRGSHSGHPRTYYLSHVGPELIQTFRNATPRYGDDGMNGSDSSVSRQNHPFLFARKFAPESLTRLLDIANDVILKD
ncbi:Core-2/I-branching beta-1,6-N-acetylglucosaminyltransferase family protein [Heracleum sosnowskyi]|uniref:Core-2/I-branching beta-1,6-N-acetylglucosaminyltransferase family protein n=1 Tax=Heracleum sosnowskyi TaxID=360622 RepID=A0AAD8MRL5_9APIA|nr:Core-2/I-branching beta-1,6-N-acetylglucosaminyltransferase family protein [Heracleum sosnowskyi]